MLKLKISQKQTQKIKFMYIWTVPGQCKSASKQFIQNPLF